MREARCDASASSALEHGSGALFVGRREYMDEAFELAERGRGRTHPNPLVGAVLVRDGRGRRAGLPSGPRRASRRGDGARRGGLAGAPARRSTARSSRAVTTGQTPPCADALVAAGVARAVVALRRPEPARRRARARAACATAASRSSSPAAQWGRARPQAERALPQVPRRRPAARHLQGGRDARRQGRRRRRRRPLDLVPGQPARRARAARRRRTL